MKIFLIGYSTGGFFKSGEQVDQRYFQALRKAVTLQSEAIDAQGVGPHGVVSI